VLIFFIKAVVVIVLLMGSVVISLTSSMYVQSGVTVMMILCMWFLLNIEVIMCLTISATCLKHS